MKTFLLSTTAALALIASAGHAQSVADQVIQRCKHRDMTGLKLQTVPIKLRLRRLPAAINLKRFMTQSRVSF